MFRKLPEITLFTNRMSTEELESQIAALNLHARELMEHYREDPGAREVLDERDDILAERDRLKRILVARHELAKRQERRRRARKKEETRSERVQRWKEEAKEEMEGRK